VTSSRRSARKSALDHQDWAADAPAAERRARADRRASDRRRAASQPAASQPARERRADDDRRATRGRRSAQARVAAETVPRRRTSSRRSARATRAAALPGPGIAERRALLLVTFLLVLYGLVMSYSASSAEAYFAHHSSFYFVERQLAWALIGVGAMLALSRVDYASWRRWSVPLAGVAVLALVVVLVPGVGSVVNGARRWIFIGGQGLQPSEVAKVACVMLAATLVSRRPAELETPRGFVRVAAITIVPAAALIMLEPDLGTMLVLVAAVVAVLVAAGARLRYLFTAAALGLATILAMIVVEPYRLQRLTTFLNPWNDAQASGYQATQALISIASGHFFGVGLGNSVQKFGFLPEQGTDMITGIIGEELGLAGLIVLLALYVALAWCCFRIALNCKELYGKLLATGITAIIIGQACINAGAALGLLPLTGVPLPLVSLGGTNLVVVLAGLGVLLNIATNRRSHIVAMAPQRASRRQPGR